MKYSYDSDELIAEVLEDIAEFGETEKVYAIYSYFEVVDGRLIDKEFITDYIHAEPPKREFIFDAEDEAEYQVVLKAYEANIKSLEQTKNKKMTLAALLQKLEEQNRLF